MASQSTLLVTNRDYLPVATQLIQNATKSIEIFAFAFSIGLSSRRLNEDSAAFQVANLLVQAKRNLGDQIRIRVYLEGHRDSAIRNRVTATYLEKRGIEVRLGKTHVKALCIDRKYLLLGSTNLTHQSISKNNETNVVVDRPSICRNYGKYFDHYWRGGNYGAISVAKPLFADGSFKYPLLDLIKKAKKTLEFSIYFFDHAEIVKALIEAHRRNVKITALVHDHRSFALSYVKRTHAAVKKLSHAGITEIAFGPDHLFTHSKFIVADQKRILLGTGNWIEEDFTLHPQLYLSIDDAKTARELSGQLAQMIREC